MAHYVVEMSGKVQVRSDMITRTEVYATTDATLAGAVAGDVAIIVLATGNGQAGICVNDYDQIHEELVLDCEGAYEITVTAKEAGNAGAAIEKFDWLYWNATDSRIDLDRADTGIVVGQALEGLTSGATGAIGVQFFRLPADKTIAA
jgi:hypothetical protein